MLIDKRAALVFLECTSLHRRALKRGIKLYVIVGHMHWFHGHAGEDIADAVGFPASHSLGTGTVGCGDALCTITKGDCQSIILHGSGRARWCL